MHVINLTLTDSSMLMIIISLFYLCSVKYNSDIMCGWHKCQCECCNLLILQAKKVHAADAGCMKRYYGSILITKMLYSNININFGLTRA